MASKSIEINDILWLKQIWKKKNWFVNLHEEHVFEQFCNIIPHLSQDQKQLVRELTDNYLWLSSREYEEKFANVVDQLKSLLSGCNTIYLFPIVKPGHDRKVKSGNHCIYYLKGSIFAFNPIYQNVNIEIIENYMRFSTIDFKGDGSEILLLVDDFIGSGETFNDAWEEIQKNASIPQAKLAILTLIIQEEAYEEINRYSIPVFFSERRKKGISDFYQTPEKESKIKIMEEIEDMIKPGSYSFGYKKSEALVTLLRTPDNTFPFFWMKYPIKGSEFNGPFFRL